VEEIFAPHSAAFPSLVFLFSEGVEPPHVAFRSHELSRITANSCLFSGITVSTLLNSFK